MRLHSANDAAVINIRTGANMILKWLKRVALLSACISAGAFAQNAATDFPSRPIRLIVPFAPGGGNDNVARTVGKKVTEFLGQGVVVENRAGAGGTIGAEVVARAKPDGYTLFLGGVGSHAINPNMMKNLPYDPIKDFAPIVLLARAPMVLVAHPKLGLHNVQELIAMAKAEPGKLNYASNGNGSSSHLAAAMFASMAGVDMVHVPYKGLSPALTDLIAGTVPLMFSSVVAILPHVKDGSLVPLGVTSDKRMPLLPNVPTIAEQGVPGYETNSWYGILAPAGTPPEIVAKLNAALNKALADPEIQKSLSLDGAQPVGGTPEEFGAYIKREKERLGDVITKAHITAQ
jgi:tripartite-type tricarboxylate transporter receptor subunit TctC